MPGHGFYVGLAAVANGRYHILKTLNNKTPRKRCLIVFIIQINQIRKLTNTLKNTDVTNASILWPFCNDLSGESANNGFY